MTITLEDVYCLIGLSIEGRPIELAGEDIAGGQYMSRFSRLASSDDDLDAVYAVRAFLVYILGCTLFTDKTGDQISCNYLRLFEDPDDFEGYMWGLQQNTEYRVRQYFAMKWAQQAHSAVSKDVVKAYRAQLDTLRAEDVVWDPYVRLLDGVGRVQTIPHPLLDHVVFRRDKKPGQYRVYEAVAPVIDPPPVVLPWDGIHRVIGYLDPVLTRWRAYDQDISMPYVMSQVEEAFETLHFRTGHEQDETYFPTG
ncbi:hypothetical protein C2S51_026125 [Perilla frutescens var. frutescens]|nr:hypothetical protein C2S51_026125 [Perilla frutescens var. frutescens]